uniref:Uncharacterized protein n=1 Tax=Nelumbo nucifera TaxID=4432 RepID=A0A822ZEU0_NELNU|nr:TPA_asm: hypothetical protein HUJ06_001313 [Nelumbo nucifera]
MGCDPPTSNFNGSIVGYGSLMGGLKLNPHQPNPPIRHL